MAPVGVGIIGLRAFPNRESLAPSPAFWGVAAHLSSIEVMPEDYNIVAVANSSVESAQKSIDLYNLRGAQAYGSAEDLAGDPRVELVVVSVNVGLHYAFAKAALAKKKNVFVEWPLGATLVEAEKLTDLAAKAGVRTMVGVQARADPLVKKLKEIVASGKIGQITSSIITCSTSILPYGVCPEGAEYYTRIETGGNLFHIFLGHILDSMVHVLGDFKDVSAMLKTYRPTTVVLNAKGEVVNQLEATAPDHMFIQGMVEKDVMTSISVRKSKARIDDADLRWIISGIEGEIEVTIPNGLWQFGLPGRALKVKMGSGETENIDFLANDTLDNEIKPPGTNTGRLYRGFAKGDTETCATFESALQTHRLLDRILKSAGWNPV
ncbi:oxidoreductase [Xylariomycetidae sp. FL2044]|nr:oxidoreductase [Xylariomycetidae sp. FL2044]